MCICGENEVRASILEISFNSGAMDQGPRLEDICKQAGVRRIAKFKASEIGTPQNHSTQPPGN